MMGYPVVMPDTPRFKIQFQHLDRDLRRAALRTLFKELRADRLSDCRTTIHHIEQAIWLYMQHPKTHYKTVPSAKDRAKWVRAVNRHSTELAALLRDSPYGKLVQPEGLLELLDWMAENTNPRAGRKAKKRGRKHEGLDWLVANLAVFFAERTDRNPGYSRNGPFFRVVLAVYDLIGIEKTGEAAAQTIKQVVLITYPPQ